MLLLQSPQHTPYQVQLAQPASSNLAYLMSAYQTQSFSPHATKASRQHNNTDATLWPPSKP